MPESKRFRLLEGSDKANAAAKVELSDCAKEQKPRRDIVQNFPQIDFRRLLGFDTLAQEVAGVVQLQSESMDAKLGAKIGAESWVDCERSELPVHSGSRP
jgi:hypothetical protein